MSDSWQTLDGIIQKLKDEADARAAQAAQAAAFRAQVPIGPPTQQQAHSAPIGPITQQQAQARGWNPPAPSVQPQQFSVPQAKPLPQVQGPSVQTSTPPISSSQQAPTLQSVTPQYVPKTPTPEVKPAFRASIAQGSPVAQGPQPNPLAQWRGAPPAGIIGPTLPATMLGNLIRPMLPKSVQDFNPLSYLPQGWQPPDYGKALTTLADQAKQTIGNVSQAITSSPEGIAAQLLGDRIAQRHQEKLYTSVPINLGFWGQSTAPSLGLNLNPVPAVVQKSGQAVERSLRFGLDVGDVLGYLSTAVLSAKPSDLNPNFGMNAMGKLTNPNEKTFGEYYALAREVGDQISGYHGQDIYNDPALVGLSGITPGSPADIAYQNSITGKAMKFFGYLNPKAWENVGNIATYWQTANQNLTNALAVTPAQKDANNQERLDYAKNLAIYNAFNGINSIENIHKSYLDLPIQVADLTNQANALATQGDAETDPAKKNILLGEAGRLGTQAAKLRYTTPLDLYNKNENLWYSLPAQIIADPLMAWGHITEAVGLTPAARRMAKASELANMPYGAEAGANKTVVDATTDFVQNLLKTQRSKAMTDAGEVGRVLTNMLSGLHTNGDIKAGIQAVLDGTSLTGIPLEQLNGADALMQGADGVYPLGWAGVKNWKFQQAVKSYTGVLDWFKNLPSLAGDAAAFANKADVQADLLGALTRAAAQAHDVSRVDSLPWGAVKVEVVPTANGNAFVQYLDEAKNVVGRSADATLREATKLETSINKFFVSGDEFKTNYAKAVGDFHRNVYSTYILNPNPGQIIGNAMGGNLLGIQDMGLSAMEYAKPMEQKVAQMLRRTGGMWPEARLAEGMGNIEPATAKGAYKATSTGNYKGLWGKFLNASTLGLAGWGRNFRQGTAAIAGVPLAEESMAFNIYNAAMNGFLNDEWPKAARQTMEQILSGRVSNPEVAKWMTDHIVQTGLSGGRVDLAKAWTDMVNGRVALSVRSIHPQLGEVLNHEHVLELDDLFRNITPDTLAQAQQRVHEIFEGQRAAVAQDISKYATSGPGRYFFTNTDTAKDVADIEQQLAHAAKMTGQSPDEAKARAQAIKPMLDQVGDNMLGLMQTAKNQPGLTDYLYDLWGRIMSATDVVRQQSSEIPRDIARKYGANAFPKLPTNAELDAMGNMTSPSYEYTLREAWKKQFDDVPKLWKDFGANALDKLNKARAAIDDGSAVRDIVNGVQPVITLDPNDPQAIEHGASQLLSDLSIDRDKAMSWIGQKVGWAGNDPRFDLKVYNLRKGVDAARARAFAMVAEYPTTESWDEYMSATYELRHEAANVLGRVATIKTRINTDPEAIVAGPLRSKLFGMLSDVNNKGWDSYFKYAEARFQNAALRVREVNLPSSIFDGLTWRPGGATGDWKLLGPNLRQAGQWDVLADNGQRTTMPASSKKFLDGVPEALIKKFNDIRATSERDVYETIGRVAGRSATSPGGQPATDEYLARMGDKYSKDMLTTIRQKVAQYMATPAAGAPVNIPAHLPTYYHQQLTQGEQAINSVLQEIATANAMGHGKLDLSAIGDFNRNVLPLFDNLMTGAQEHGKQMLSLDMIDFTNNYHPDVLLGLAAPYNYWWSRMLKNTVERQLFQPKVGQLLAHALGAVESYNRGQDQPDRNIDMLPGGVQIGDTRYNTSFGLVPRWMPWDANMAANGWSDPDRANQAYEYINEVGKEQSFPATAKGLAGNLVYFKEVANQLGLSTYQDLDSLIDFSMGRPVDTRGWLGDLSPMYRVMGWASVPFANWAKDNGHPWLAQAAQTFGNATLPSYTPYLVGRQASFDTNRGVIPNDQTSQFIQDVGAQQNSGFPPLPEQAFLDPNAQAQYQQEQNKVATEYFIRSLISWVTGAPIAAQYGAETNLRAAKEQQGLMGYSPDNPAGSQTAKFSMATPGNANYVQGLAPYNSQYAVTAEKAPGVPDLSATRPGESAAQTAYYAEKDAIFKKYEDAAQAAYTAHPEWADRTTSGPAADFKKAQNDAKQQELKDLDTKYPTISTQEKGSAQYSESAARPSEVVNRAQQRLYSQANKNIPYPPDGSPAAAYDAHDAALEAEVNRLMGQPGNVLYNEPGNVSRDIGRHPRGESNVLQGSPPVPSAAGESPATSPQVPTASGAVDASPYATDFAAAETANGLPTGLLSAVQANETTDGNVKAVSDAGAQGLMQVMPDTWKEWAPKVGATDPNNPQDSIKVAAAYLAWLQATLPKDKQDVKSLAIAYNFGIGNVLNGKTPPPETLAYANRIANAVQAAGTPQFISPLPAGTKVSQGFGDNVADYAKWNGDHGHEGIDYSVPVGTPVGAAATGTVEFAGTGNGFGNYGNYIVIDHGNGLKTYYGHLSELDVKPGDTVTQGDIIGLSGNSGRTTGPHLHFSIRKDGDKTGPYGMVDPNLYLGQLQATASSGIVPSAGASTVESIPQGAASTGASVSPQPPTETPVSAQVPVASPVPPVGAATSPAVTTLPTATNNAGAFPWGGTAKGIIASQSTANKAPAQAAAEASVNQQYADIDARAVAAYPQGAGLYQEYRTLTDDQKKPWAAAHPLIRAMHLAGYDPAEYSYMEKNFGKGVVEKWASIPPYTGEGDDSASKYYHANPDVFVAKSWLQGRPEVHDDSTFDPNQPFEYDAGKDYDTAKSMFGDGIWDTVRQYYSIPPYVKGGDNKAWIDFKTNHPEYDSWRTWWYANLPGQQASTFGQYQGRGGYASHGHGNGFGQSSHGVGVNPVAFWRQSPPQFQAPGNGDSGWRQWLALTESDLKNWRR